MVERLSPSDASALQAERGPVHMHVGGVLTFDGAVPYEAVLDRLAKRLPLIPRYLMRLEEGPLGLATPMWVQDERFDVERHVHRVALPAPGGDAELCELVGRTMSEPLDRSRALWQMLLVEGLSGGRTALVAKMHHALVDGIAAVDVSTVILDPTPEELELPLPDAAPAPRQRARIEQLARLAAAQVSVPRDLARETLHRGLTTDPREAANRARSAAGVLHELTRIRPMAPDTRLNAEIGRDRRFALARGSLERVKEVRRAAEATVNDDVLLAAVALMLSEYLGDDAPDHVVALVPVSVRGAGHDGELGNHIATVFVDLPLTGEPLERVSAVSAAMSAAKGSSQVSAGALIVGATGLAPPVVSSLAVRAMSGPRLFNLVVSNVPGPQQTLYLAGVPMREAFPAVPLNPRNQALSVGVLTYDGGVHFGLLADREALPDVGAAATGLDRALATLSAAATS